MSVAGKVAASAAVKVLVVAVASSRRRQRRSTHGGGIANLGMSAGRRGVPGLISCSADRRHEPHDSFVAEWLGVQVRGGSGGRDQSVRLVARVAAVAAGA